MTDRLKEIRAEGDGAEIVREAKSAAVHRTTYTLDGRGAETLALRNAKLSKHILALVDYIEAMGGVPAGWKLVPVEPTSEMKIAGAHAHDQRPSEVAAIYAAMLAASPTPPTESNPT